MTVVTQKRVNNQKLKKIFGLKSYDEILGDLATSRAQFKSGKYKKSGVVLKGLRTKYGL